MKKYHRHGAEPHARQAFDHLASLLFAEMPLGWRSRLPESSVIDVATDVMPFVDDMGVTPEGEAAA